MSTFEPMDDFEQRLRAIRQDLHAHPELAFEEHRTADVVAEWLTRWDIPVVRGLGGTGLVGVIKRGTGERAIGLRADMDALPVQELNTFSHASRHPGRMHACGHDGHTAMLLGAAYHLSRTHTFDGTVYLVFQPAEEGGGGARRMIEDGLFTRFPMEAIYGIHNWPELPVGHIGVRSGAFMASSNEFDITVHGKGAHAAMPHLGTDPILAAVQMAQALQTVITRNKHPVHPAVLSISQITAGTTTNVLPDTALMRGTVRTFSDEVLDRIEARMSDIVHHMAAAMEAKVDFSFQRNYPTLINHDEPVRQCLQVGRELFGADHVHDDVEPTLGAEDFAFFLREIPGCYLFLGNGQGDHRLSGHGLGPCRLHNASYDFNDALLPLGAAFWVRLVESLLQAKPPLTTRDEQRSAVSNV